MNKSPLLLSLAPVLAALLGLTASGCANLPDIPAGICGNGVVDPGEDCDSLVSSAAASCRAPGADRPCRFDCSAGHACPAGFGCGLDAVCRAPTLAWKPFGAPLTTGSERPLLGDLDGDRRADLVAPAKPDFSGASTTSAHFFDTTGALSKTVSVPPQLRFPTIASLTGDAPGDLLFGTERGVGLLAGQPDRGLLPLAYPLFVTGAVGFSNLALPVHWSGPFSRIALLAETGDGGLQIGHAPLSDAEQMSLSQRPPPGADCNANSTQAPDIPRGYRLDGKASLADLPDRRRPSVGQFNEQLPCDAIVVALVGHPEVTVFASCFLDKDKQLAWNDGAEGSSAPVVVELGTRTVKQGSLVADMNGDGHLDLLVGVDDGGTEKILVAYGKGDGRFFSPLRTISLVASPLGGAGAAGGGGGGGAGGDAGASGSAGAAGSGGAGKGGGGQASGTGRFDVDDAAVPSGSIPLPLAAGDLDGDGIPDFVTHKEVLLSREIPGAAKPEHVTHWVLSTKVAGLWNEALIADLNGDGLADVVAASSSSPNVDFLAQSASGALHVFNPSTLPTSGDVSYLSVGDFDGDLINDVVFRESSTQPNASGGGQVDPAAGVAGVEDSVTVSFGQRSGAPTAPASLARFSYVQQIATGNIETSPPTGLTDIGVLASRSTDPSIGVSILYGNGTREPIAAFGLSNPACGIQATPLAATTGYFGAHRSPTSTLDLAVLALDGARAAAGDPCQQQPSARLWTVPTGPGGVFLKPTVSALLPAGYIFSQSEHPVENLRELMDARNMDPALASGGRVTESFLETFGIHAGARMRSADLDGDGVDEIVLLSSSPRCDSTASASPLGSALLIFSSLEQSLPDGAGGQVAGRVLTLGSSIALPNAALFASQLLLSDLDGDGRVDIVAMVDGTQVLSWTESHLLVLWNEGGLKFTDPAPLLDTEVLDLRDAALPTRAAGRAEVFLVGKSGAYRATALRGEPRRFHAERLPDLPDGTGIALGDLDGDGLEDLAIANIHRSQVSLFTRIPTLP